MPTFTAPDYQVLEPDVYDAELAGTEDRVSEKDNHPFVWWSFDAEYDGRQVTVTGVTSTKFGPKAKARQWAEALLGRSIEPGEVVELNDLVGRKCQLVLTTVKQDEAVFNRIETVLRARRNGQAKVDATGEPLE